MPYTHTTDASWGQDYGASVPIDWAEPPRRIIGGAGLR